MNKENDDSSSSTANLWVDMYKARMAVPDYLKGEELLLWACNEALLELRYYHNRSDYLPWRANRILQQSIDKYTDEKRQNRNKDEKE